MMQTTKDYVMNGRIALFQPMNGYRVAIDPLMLSACVPLQSGQSVLDVGCGVGTIAIALKMREPLSEVTAIDIDGRMVELCKKNSVENAVDIRCLTCSISDAGKLLEYQEFDHVVTNPPYFRKESSRISTNKEFANFETITLQQWIQYSLKRVKSGGIFSIIHDATRIADILHACDDVLGDIVVVPIFSKSCGFAKRVILRGVKGRKTAPKIHHGLVVHNSDGSYTSIMKKILAGEPFLC